MHQLPHRATLASALTLVTVVGFVITVVGCIYSKPVAISIGIATLVAPLLGIIAYVCYDDLRPECS